MDLIECYTSACRVALRAVGTDPSTWQEMHTLLRGMHERLSCGACRRLPHAAAADGSAACSACTDDDRRSARGAPLSRDSMARCYRKLCAYIRLSSLYDVMCSRPEDDRLVRLLDEAAGASRPTANGRADAPTEPTVGPTEPTDPSSAAAAAASVVLHSPPVHPSHGVSGERGGNLQLFNVQAPLGDGAQSRPDILHGVLPRKKKNERGCRCGNATSTPGKLTCFGQRCPCYTEQKPCDRCKCRGCRNPRQKRPNDDDSLEISQIRRKPVTLELVSSLKPSHFKSKPVFSSYTMHDVLQFPARGQNYDQGTGEVTLGHVNSIFHSP